MTEISQQKVRFILVLNQPASWGLNNLSVLKGQMEHWKHFLSPWLFHPAASCAHQCRGALLEWEMCTEGNQIAPFAVISDSYPCCCEPVFK